MIEYNNRFRFRVWHKNLRKFLTEDEWYMGIDGKIRYHEMGGGMELVEEPHVIEQCTGAKDKNEKLIYEGDIVKVKRSWLRPKVVEKTNRGKITHEIDYEWKVAEEEEVGHIIWSWCSHKWLVSYEYKRYDDTDDFSGIAHRYEVIGNVHENGELVKYED